MSCTGYTPLTKTVILPAVGTPPPVNGFVLLFWQSFINLRAKMLSISDLHLLPYTIPQTVLMLTYDTQQHSTGQLRST